MLGEPDEDVAAQTVTWWVGWPLGLRATRLRP